MGVIGGLCLLGYVFSEIFPVALVLKMMLFRSTLFFKVFGLICTAAYLRGLIDRQPMVGWVVASLCTLGMTFEKDWVILALSLGIAFEMYHVWRGRRKVRSGCKSRDPVNHPYARIDGLLQRSASRVAVAFPAVIIVMTATYQPWPVHVPGHGPPSDTETIATWARESTPTDARFVAPPDVDFASFKVLAARSTLGDTKLAGQALFDPAFGRLLYKRLADLGCRVPDGPWCAGNTYGSFGTDRFRDLGARYGACYAITRSGQDLNLPRLYRNDSFQVFSLCIG
jgi:hypothetical protein